jgi:hypothetical protein
VTPFRTVVEQTPRWGSANIDPIIPNAELSQTVVKFPTPKCESRWITDRVNYDFTNSPVIYTDNYDRTGDDTVGFQGGGYGSSYYTFTPDIYTQPETLDVKTFEHQLNDYVLSDLPNEETKKRVRDAFDRLKPDPKKKEQDAAEKTLWTGWAKKSAAEQKASPDSHAKALTARLEAIACVGEGAPYVARGLLRAGRFDRLYADKAKNDSERSGILERFRAASGGGEQKCLGARGLTEDDLRKLAPRTTPAK